MAKSERKITIKDVAREAGVSISTVSNALNDVDVLNPRTKQHVLEVAERLSYVPNQNGQRLRGKETKAIGLFVTSMRGAYYGVLADTMHWQCHKYGYELYIYIANHISTVTNNILGRRVDGAVILYGGLLEESEEKLKKSEVPVVFLDREIAHPNLSSVVFDSYQEGEMAAKYLLSLGHREIGHIYGLKDNYDSIQRYRGFEDALIRAGLCLKPEFIWDGLFERDAAYRQTKRHISAGLPLPDAIFAANDLSAIGCMEALHEEGIKVPGDISIIGCDDIETCELLSPPLTTIRTSFDRQGAVAIDVLMEMLGGKTEGKIEKIEGKIIVRNSCIARK